SSTVSLFCGNGEPVRRKGSLTRTGSPKSEPSSFLTVQM
ncbi:unnamed protein product, partial [Oikopleura dioica]